MLTCLRRLNLKLLIISYNNQHDVHLFYNVISLLPLINILQIKGAQSDLKLTSLKYCNVSRGDYIQTEILVRNDETLNFPRVYVLNATLTYV